MIDGRIGPYLLTAIKAPVTAQMVNAVLAWATLESGGRVTSNNPWNQHSWGGLLGQTGYRYAGPGDKNVAIFDTLEHGVDAAAQNLINHGSDWAGYDRVIAAAKADKPIDFLNALARSAWSGNRYGTKNGGPNTLLEVYARIQPPDTSTPPSNGVAPVKYINASGYDLSSLPHVDAPAGTQISDFEGNPVARLATPTSLSTTGLADGHGDLFSVVIQTGRYYQDRKLRPTWQLATIPGGVPA